MSFEDLYLQNYETSMIERSEDWLIDQILKQIWIKYWNKYETGAATDSPIKEELWVGKNVSITDLQHGGRPSGQLSKVKFHFFFKWWTFHLNSIF